MNTDSKPGAAMSTPEEVAARPDWADEKAVGIVRCWLDSSGTLAAAIATAIREAEQRALASQRATIERLEREATGLKELLALSVEALDWHSRGCGDCRPFITKVRAALSTTGATTGEDRG